MKPNYDLLIVWIQAGTGLFIFAAFLIYFFQLMAMRRGTRGQNSISLINFIQDEKARDAREIVMKNLKGKAYCDWSPNELKAASNVCSSYDVVSILIYQQALVPQNLIITNWGPSIIKCYKILEVHIKEMQKPENAGPEYWDDFVKLYEEVVKSGRFNYIVNNWLLNDEKLIAT
jgi:hypothetical protein